MTLDMHAHMCALGPPPPLATSLLPSPAGHVRLLAVQPKEVPLVADMLQKHCGAEPPQRLSGAVRQRQEVQGAEQPENDLSALLQQAAPLITRLLYTAGLRVYKRALEADPSLNDLLNMQVASVQEVVAVYSLPVRSCVGRGRGRTYCRACACCTAAGATHCAGEAGVLKTWAWCFVAKAACNNPYACLAGRARGAAARPDKRAPALQ